MKRKLKKQFTHNGKTFTAENVRELTMKKINDSKKQTVIYGYRRNFLRTVTAVLAITILLGMFYATNTFDVRERFSGFFGDEEEPTVTDVTQETTETTIVTETVTEMVTEPVTTTLLTAPAAIITKTDRDYAEYYDDETLKNTAETKDYVYYKMLNSIFYFDYASGKINYWDSRGNSYNIEFKTDLINLKAYEESIIEFFEDSTTYKNVMIYDGNREIPDSCRVANGNLYSFDFNSYTYDILSSFRRDEMQPLNSQRVTISNDGEKSYRGLMNATNVHYAAEYALFPQSLSFGFLEEQDLWEITGIEKISGRDCVVISGKSNGYGRRFDVENFVLYMDLETGVWLKFDGFNSKDELTFYINTDISFDKPTDFISIDDFIILNPEFTERVIPDFPSP